MTWNDINVLALRILTRWWIVVIVTGLVVTVAGWRAVDSSEKYRATELMVLGPAPGSEQSDAFRVADLLNRESVMATIVDVMSSPMVIGSAMVTAGEVTTGSILWPGYEVWVTREPGSSVMRVTAEGPDEHAVVTLAEHTRMIGESTVAGLYPGVTMTSLSAGSPQAEKSGISLVRVVGIGLFVGLGFGLLIALWFDSLLEYRRRSSSLAAPTAVRSPTTVDIGPAGKQVVTSRRA